MKILLVEDDDFKGQALAAALSENLPCTLIVTKSVADSVRVAFSTIFDLVILDMALPSYTKSNSSMSGSSQPQGGIEVLKTLHHLKRTTTKVLIVSQYESIEIEGRFIELMKAKQKLMTMYALNILDPILYQHENLHWKEKFLRAISAI